MNRGSSFDPTTFHMCFTLTQLIQSQKTLHHSYLNYVFFFQIAWKKPQLTFGDKGVCVYQDLRVKQDKYGIPKYVPEYKFPDISKIFSIFFFFQRFLSLIIDKVLHESRDFSKLHNFINHNMELFRQFGYWVKIDILDQPTFQTNRSMACEFWVMRLMEV